MPEWQTVTIFTVSLIFFIFSRVWVCWVCWWLNIPSEQHTNTTGSGTLPNLFPLVIPSVIIFHAVAKISFKMNQHKCWLHAIHTYGHDVSCEVVGVRMYRAVWRERGNAREFVRSVILLIHNIVYIHAYDSVKSIKKDLISGKIYVYNWHSVSEVQKKL